MSDDRLTKEKAPWHFRHGRVFWDKDILVAKNWLKKRIMEETGSRFWMHDLIDEAFEIE